MARKGKLDWGSSHKKLVDDSGIVTEFITHAHEPNKVYTRQTQPTEDLILHRNERMRIEKPQRDLSFGRQVANIPFIRYQKLLKENPDLESNDKDIQAKAWARVLKSPENGDLLIVEKY